MARLGLRRPRQLRHCVPALEAYRKMPYINLFAQLDPHATIVVTVQGEAETGKPNRPAIFRCRLFSRVVCGLELAARAASTRGKKKKKQLRHHRHHHHHHHRSPTSQNV